MVAKLETGVTAPRFRTIEALAVALGIDPAELFTSDPPCGTHKNKALNDFTAHFARFSAQELAWAKNLIDAALKSKSQT